MTLSLEKILTFLAASAAEQPSTDESAELADVPFPMLGYDSLIVLRTVGQIERTYRIELPETIMSSVKTPRQLLEQVNAQITGV